MVQMIRRIAALLLILLQAIQGLAVPHAHADVPEPANHGGRPHIHLGLGHHHHDGRHHHEDDAAAVPEIPLHEHDSDAFYVSSETALPGRAVLTFNPAPWQELIVFSASVLSQAVLPPAVAPPESLPPPGPAGRSGCPVYLQHLTLLI